MSFQFYLPGTDLHSVCNSRIEVFLFYYYFLSMLSRASSKDSLQMASKTNRDVVRFYQGDVSRLTYSESAIKPPAFAFQQLDLEQVCDALQCWDQIKLFWSSSKHNRRLWEPYCMEFLSCCLIALTS